MIRKKADPAVECIRFLSQHFTQEDGTEESVEQECQRLSEKYRIPAQKMDAIKQPLVLLESGLREALEAHRELWGDLFYPGACEGELLLFSFFMMEQQGDVYAIPPLQFRRRLTASMLSLDMADMNEVSSQDELIELMYDAAGSAQLKWTCAQVWQNPYRYYERYRQLIALAQPVLERCAPQLQPLIDEAVAILQSPEAKTNINEVWVAMETEQPSDEQIIIPMCIDFNWHGYCWDETLEDSPTYQFIGVYRDRLKAHIRCYDGNEELLIEQMKTVFDPSRLRILKVLKQGARCGQALSEHLNLSPGTISYHMNYLVRAGFVRMSKEGNKINYSLDQTQIEQLLQDLRLQLLEKH